MGGLGRLEHIALGVVLPAVPGGLLGLRSAVSETTPLLAVGMLAPMIFMNAVAGFGGLVAH